MEKGLIFTYAMTALGAVGGLLSPFFGLLVYVCFAIIRPDHMWSWSVVQGNYSRVIAVAMLAGWAAHGFGRWRFGRAGAVVGCMLGYWFWTMLSAVQAIDAGKAWELVEFFAKVFLPFLVGITTLRTVGQLKQLAWVILLSQGYVAFEMNLSYLGGYNRVYHDGFGGMDNNCVAIAMVTGIGLAFFLGLAAREWWKKGLALLAAALMGHTILLTFSRGGILALALTGLMAFVLIPKTPRHYLIFAAAVVAGIVLSGKEVRERFFSTFQESDSGKREASAQSRLNLWSGAVDATLKRPLLGAGPDNWGEVAPEYGWKKGKEAHSLWAQNAAELGFPGVLLLLGFFVLLMTRLWPLTRVGSPVSDPWLRDAARMVIASLFGFVIAAQFVTIKYLEVPFYVALIGAGVLKMTESASAVWEPAYYLPPLPWRTTRASAPSASV